MINYRNKKYVCHLDLAMDLIRGKWKAVILCHLFDGPKRFLELQRITSGISQKVLTEKLNQLEDDGLVLKTVYPDLPPKVEYTLSPSGKELYPALSLLEKWSTAHYPKVED